MVSTKRKLSKDKIYYYQMVYFLKAKKLSFFLNFFAIEHFSACVNVIFAKYSFAGKKIFGDVVDAWNINN